MRIVALRFAGASGQTEKGDDRDQGAEEARGAPVGVWFGHGKRA